MARDKDLVETACPLYTLFDVLVMSESLLVAGVGVILELDGFINFWADLLSCMLMISGKN